jgi:hypothetical protein
VHSGQHPGGEQLLQPRGDRLRLGEEARLLPDELHLRQPRAMESFVCAPVDFITNSPYKKNMERGMKMKSPPMAG